ncbi:MAG: DegT/DnrJ/EryC1/StrS family aminotransferase, partial [Candidatus Hydrogenedentota bacterium]
RLAPLYGLSPRLRLDCGPNRTCVAQDTGPWRGPALSVNHGAAALRRVIENGAVDSPINVYEGVGSAGDSDIVYDSELETALNEVKSVLNGIDSSSSYYHNAKRLAELRAIPVDQGGEPAAPRFIPLARPMLGPEEDEAVLEAFRSGWLTSGPQIAAFEKAFARTVGADHAVAVVSCTAALHLCLVHAGVGPGDEVITSPITWASTGNTILSMGARVVFADVEPDTLNIDPAAIERAITPRTKAIVPVHLAGQPADMREINAIAAKHGITVVEDAAHALGTTYNGSPIGSGPNFQCFSFYAIKNITTMEGGAITTRDAAVAQHLRLLAANGMSATAWDRYGRSAAPGPAMLAEPGYKYLLGNVNAAIGLKQLQKFPEFKRRRAELAALYLELLRDVPEARPLAIRADRGHAWHLMIVRLDLPRLGLTRDEVMAALRRENIGTVLHFYGLHLHPYYRDVVGMRPEELPNATAASNEIVSLPLYPGMTDADVRHVVDALKKVATARS